MIEFVTFRKLTRKKPTCRQITDMLIHDCLEPFIHANNLLDPADPLVVVCEGQVSRNIKAMVIQAYSNGYFRGLSLLGGCFFETMPGAEKFKNVDGWAKEYADLGECRGKKEHKRLSIRLAKEAVSNPDTPLHPRVQRLCVSQKVHDRLSLAREDKKEDDVCDAIIQMISYICRPQGGGEPPSKRSRKK